MKVACIGECMVELTLPREPAGATRVGFAGDTFNAAVYLKRCAPKIAVAYVTAVGTDALSEGMVAAFVAEGLDTGLVERRADRAPGLYAISVDAQGERSFTYWRDSSAARTLFLPPATVTPERLAGFDLLYLSGITVAVMAPEGRAALLDFLPGYRAGGGRVAFDSNYRPRLWSGPEVAQRELAAFWRVTDIGLPSIDDEMALWGDKDACGGAAAFRRLRRAGGGAEARGGRAAADRAVRGAAGLSRGGDRGRYDGGGGQLQRRLSRGAAAGRRRGRAAGRRARDGGGGHRASGGDHPAGVSAGCGRRGGG